MIPSRKSSRRKWKIHDGPRGSLRRLRNQLAEDGCVESQVALAKQLLEERCELEADRLSNFQQAVEWLICATEHGHHEARKLLKSCVRSSIIPVNNVTIVRAKSCLAASRQEIVARRAARDLFASLSNGEEYITVQQLESKIKKICQVDLAKDKDYDTGTDSDPKDEDNLDAIEPSDCGMYDAGDTKGNRINGESLSGHQSNYNDMAQNYNEDLDVENIDEDGASISEDNLVSAAVNYCRGYLPEVSGALTLTEPSVKALDSIPFMSRALLHPWKFIHILYIKLLSYFASLSYINSNSQLFILLFVYFIMGTENAMLFIPLAMYYLSFCVMIISTFKMLHAKREFIDFRMWSGLFLRYSVGNLDSDVSENLFLRKNLKPFVHFFISLIVHLSLYPLVSSQWILLSEFCIMSAIFTFLTLYSFRTQRHDRRYPEYLTLVSFVLNVLAKYPYEMDTVVSHGWRFLDLHIQTYPSYIIGTSIEIFLNSRLFFYLLIPVVLVLISRKQNWQGVFEYTLPHCVTLSWLQLFIISSRGATMYGLVRGTLAFAGLFCFLPMMGIITFFLPIFALIKSISMSDVLYFSFLIGGFVLSMLAACTIAKLDYGRKYLAPVQVVFGIITIMYLLKPHIQYLQQNNVGDSILGMSDDKSGVTYMKDYDEIMSNYHLLWDEYQTYCHVASWTNTNMAATQLKCSMLDGARVNWEGYVTEVRVIHVHNAYEELAKNLPAKLGEHFRCYFGQEYNSPCELEGTMDMKECDFIDNVIKSMGRKCHLNNLNKYSFEITVKLEIGILMKKGSEFSLVANHQFTNLTRRLRNNDRIQFKGVLTNGVDGSSTIGGPKPRIEVYEVKCLHCADRLIQGEKFESDPPFAYVAIYKSLINDVSLSARYILNFVFNPIVVFK